MSFHVWGDEWDEWTRGGGFGDGGGFIWREETKTST